jgi:hypothetical protein
MATTPKPSFYGDDGHLTKRGIRVTDLLNVAFSKLFKKAGTPRECMDLERAIQRRLSLSATCRILRLQCQRAKGKKW